MIYLALDTANHLCAAALYDGASDTILAENTEDIGRGHAEHLMDVIGECFSRAGLEYADIGGVICTIGPGSFTGVRVGLASARGIALGLGIPIIGLSTLDALAQEADAAGALVTLLDARREEAYVQWRGDINAPLPNPGAVSYDLLVEHLDGQKFDICGSGASEFNSRIETQYRVLHELSAASIATIARLGAVMNANTAPPEPLYLRAPDAKPQKLPKFALAGEA